MAEIVLQVSSEERQTFNSENRPIWPRVPTPCLVESCGETEFKNFKDFLTHWKKTHEITNTVHTCSCGKKFAVIKHLKAHLKISPNHTGGKDKTVPNKSYIDPAGVLPYQFGNKEDRGNMKDLQKFLASEKRKKEADRFKDAREVLCSTSRKNVCRDERIVERYGKILKDTNLWDEPKRMKRIDFK